MKMYGYDWAREIQSKNLNNESGAGKFTHCANHNKISNSYNLEFIE